MKLSKVRITHFKCVKDSTEFTIDHNVTCLVGKNESGKTAILQSIERINPLNGRPSHFADLDYTAADALDYKSRSDKEPHDAIVTTWLLDDSDIHAIDSVVGSGVVTAKEMTITKGFGGKHVWDLAFNEKATFQNALRNSTLFDEERTALEGTGTIKALIETLTAKTAPAEGVTEDVRSPREQSLLDHLNATFPEGSVWKAIAGLIQQRLPTIAYFSEYTRMPGQVALDDLKARIAAGSTHERDEVFLALLAMISSRPEDLENISKFEPLQRELENASSGISRRIFKYWSQNRHLLVQFRFEQALPGDPKPFNTGYIMRTRIYNTRHNVSTPFDERSTGFVWFFSFLVWYSQLQRKYGENLILLLDEPGMGLHAKAQADLLRYIDTELATKFQVIYTTHSPFMIDAQNVLRARTVEDVFVEAKDGQDAQDLGTKVGDEVLSTDRDTLFPLQACLGYEITQTLFVGENCLLVEGPSEILYFPWFDRKLREANRTGLDQRWTLTPCGGADKIPAFLSLFSGQKLNIAIVLDYAQGQKGAVEKLRKSSLLNSGRVVTADQFAGQSEADTEDLLGRGNYLALVNACYGLTGTSALSSGKPSDAPIRVVKEVEDHFRTQATSGPGFDHYRPSEYLTQQGLGFAFPDLPAALSRFEQLFTALNAFLPTK